VLKMSIRSAWGAALLSILGVVAVSAQRATPVEAKAMLAKAVAYYKQVGRDQALKDFTAKKPPFFDRDLYVVCIGPKGVVTAHGALAAYVGQSADALRDAEGKPLGSAIFNLGSTKGSGELTYPMQNPVSKRVESKHSFVEKIGEDVCAVGAYTGS
jgi:cytochrome c